MNELTNTQGIDKLPAEVKKQHMATRSDADLPGERSTQEAPGEAKEGSARKYADVMDNITGSTDENRSREMKRSRKMG